MRVMAAVVVAAAVFACAGAASADTQAARPAIEVLSRPGQLSRWAFVVRAALARRQPDANARPVARMHLKTHDGTDELVEALARTTDASGRAWVQIRLPILPNGSTGWVPADALTGF